MEQQPRQPLAGLTVLDLSHVYAAPYATLLLALAGARVIKIEPPGGEHLRKRGTVAAPRYAYAMLNSNKECITLDLKSTAGVEVFNSLLEQADAVVENFRPGTMDRLGIGYEQARTINPRIVYASTSGYGSTGRYASYPAMDVAIQAMSGVVDVTGYPDQPAVKAGIAACDFSSGIHLYGALLTALYQREQTGEGSRVETSMMESVFPTLLSSLSLFYSTQEHTHRVGNHHGGLSVAPYTIYPTLDGQLAVVCEGDHHWRALCEIMGRPELGTNPDFATTRERVSRMDEVDRIVGDWCATQHKLEAFELLRHRGVPSAPVRRLGDVATDPALFERGYLETVEHPELGPTTLMRSAIRFPDQPLPPLDPAHALGADTDGVARDLLGLDEKRLGDLRRAGAFG
ncbi:CaiB/BaiF CoA transferase family protein [Ornithinimicrobium cavernae]|uniref:CaiB/BaiF CoA transferase family protein n=1 Tax=Ornithinimicrobium cavernae TaxID=2666047 RepID=UPI000D6951AB|nr:CoA transferase [Ornithinimicrobium cavernae]